jgi:hypothetical protein
VSGWSATSTGSAHPERNRPPQRAMTVSRCSLVRRSSLNLSR